MSIKRSVQLSVMYSFLCLRVKIDGSVLLYYNKVGEWNIPLQVMLSQHVQKVSMNFSIKGGGGCHQQLLTFLTC